MIATGTNASHGRNALIGSGVSCTNNTQLEPQAVFLDSASTDATISSAVPRRACASNSSVSRNFHLVRGWADIALAVAPLNDGVAPNKSGAGGDQAVAKNNDVRILARWMA